MTIYTTGNMSSSNNYVRVMIIHDIFSSMRWYISSDMLDIKDMCSPGPLKLWSLHIFHKFSQQKVRPPKNWGIHSEANLVTSYSMSTMVAFSTLLLSPKFQKTWENHGNHIGNTFFIWKIHENPPSMRFPMGKSSN